MHVRVPPKATSAFTSQKRRHSARQSSSSARRTISGVIGGVPAGTRMTGSPSRVSTRAGVSPRRANSDITEPSERRSWVASSRAANRTSSSMSSVVRTTLMLVHQRITSTRSSSLSLIGGWDAAGAAPSSLRRCGVPTHVRCQVARRPLPRCPASVAHPRARSRPVVRVERGTLRGADQIGLAVGPATQAPPDEKAFRHPDHRHRIHVCPQQRPDHRRSPTRRLLRVRTSVPADTLPTHDVVRAYKGLEAVERAFGTLKDPESRSARSTTASKTGSARTCCCACSTTTSPCTSRPPGRRCCSQMSTHPSPPTPSPKLPARTRLAAPGYCAATRKMGLARHRPARPVSHVST